MRTYGGWPVVALAAAASAIGVPVVGLAQAGTAADGAGSYGFHGEYTPGERGLVDLGQRWYDPKHQIFYSADPAPADDPAALVGEPRLTSSYALNHANSLRYTDPDGREPERTGLQDGCAADHRGHQSLQVDGALRGHRSRS